jgi:hypothetical protein
VDLGGYSGNSAGNPVHDIYDELHNRVRNRVFHAKDGLQPFLPQDLASRAQVAEAKERYGDLYLDLAGKAFRTHFPAGYQTRLGPAVHDVFKKTAQDWSIAFTSDPAPVDVSEPDVSPGGEAVVTLPAVEFTDPRGDDFTALMARAVVPEVAATVPAVGRLATVNPEGQLGIIESLEGRLTLAGFDRCEFVVSVSMTGRKVRKTLYAT